MQPSYTHASERERTNTRRMQSICGASATSKKRHGRLLGCCERGKAGYVCALRGDACALARSQTNSALSSLVRVRCARPYICAQAAFHGGVSYSSETLHFALHESVGTRREI